MMLKYRVTRTTLDVPEPKPRESGNLSLNSTFGSNSSISSGSAYGSVRKKKQAPRPPLLHESAASSLTSSPTQSVVSLLKRQFFLHIYYLHAILTNCFLNLVKFLMQI